ncbi:ABC transporter permease [Methylibium sp.]|uniref:ABC transporter permease n=1 Tax=Methylibium sp. TaxID=2067992 RepID=UPI00184878D5|nr:ABC transporter permease [Methylibium sp.]MBA3592046.1 ABC transporter permease [Methylibium sp.]
MNAFAALRSAWRALTANPMRSVLTMLGVMIGVAAVITTLAIGNGAQQRIAEQIKALGSNLMLVLPGAVSASGLRLGASSGQRLTEADAQAIAAEIPEVMVAAPSLHGTVQVVSGNVNWATRAVGTTPDYLVSRNWPLAKGRDFDAAELAGSGKVVILGDTVARELFGAEDPLDRVIRVRQVPLTVIGVLSRKGQNAQGEDQDDTLMMPISTFRNRINSWLGGPVKRVYVVSVKVHEGMSMAAAEAGIRSLMRQRHRLEPGKDDDFNVRNLTEVMQAQEETGRVLALLLAAVAGVSLLVGGIGIMNIMLVSVTERTREIGLRRAVGARSRDILAQFLIEAVSLSLAGGAIGVLLGAGVTAAVAAFAGWQVVMSASAIVLAVGFSAAVGVFFGFYPARRAAALLPIEALRHE